MTATAISFQTAFFDDIGGVDGLNHARGVAVSPDGHQVFVTGKSDNALAVFDRDTATGGLVFRDAFFNFVDDVNGLGGAEKVAVSPDGKQIFVTGAIDNAMAVFDRDVATGNVAFQTAFFHNTVPGGGGVDALLDPRAVTVSPDGRQVFVTSARVDALTVFDRDAATGNVAVRGTFVTGVDGVIGLDGVKEVVVSPDGNQVFTTSFENALAVFDRNPTTGDITFQTALFDTMSGVDGLGGAEKIAVSPDGNQIYVAGALDKALAVFDRDAASGQVTFQRAFFDGSDGVDGLELANGVAITPSGEHLFVVSDGGVSGSAGDRSLAVFSRDTATGALTYAGTLADGVGGVSGLIGAEEVVVSPDGKQVFVTSDFQNSLAVFAIDRFTPNTALTVNALGKPLRVFEGAVSDRYELSLGTQPASDVTIALTTSGSLQTIPETLTFTPSNWETPQTVTVFAPDDTDVIGPRSATITHHVRSDDRGFDTLSLPSLAAALSDNDSDTPGIDTLFTTSATFSLTDHPDSVIASSGDDNGYARGGNDILVGGGGRDRLFGVGGDDAIFGDNFADTPFGSLFSDTQNPQNPPTQSNDVLFGGVGNDFLVGGGGVDVLLGELGDDVLFGGAGDDVLAGGAGNDDLFGGAGNDVFLLTAGGDDGVRLGTGLGQDTVQGFSPIGDRFYLADGLQLADLTITYDGGHAIIAHTATGQTLAVVTNTPSLSAIAFDAGESVQASVTAAPGELVIF